MTQANLARAMGVTPQAVNAYLRREPHPTTLAAILRALGYTEEQIQDVRLGEFYSIAPERAASESELAFAEAVTTRLTERIPGLSVIEPTQSD